MEFYERSIFDSSSRWMWPFRSTLPFLLLAMSPITLLLYALKHFRLLAKNVALYWQYLRNCHRTGATSPHPVYYKQRNHPSCALQSHSHKYSIVIASYVCLCPALIFFSTIYLPSVLAVVHSHQPRCKLYMLPRKIPILFRLVKFHDQI